MDTKANCEWPYPNSIEESTIRTRVLQLQVKTHGTLQATQICLKRKGVNDLYSSQTDGKKQNVERTQPNATSAISDTDRVRIEYTDLEHLSDYNRTQKSGKKVKAK